MQVVSKGFNFNNKEIFLVTLGDGTTIECTETYRNSNRFNRVYAARRSDNKIEVIKQIRFALNLGLKDAKDLVEALWR